MPEDEHTARLKQCVEVAAEVAKDGLRNVTMKDAYQRTHYEVIAFEQALDVLIARYFRDGMLRSEV